jgi:hypothetical protein
MEIVVVLTSRCNAQCTHCTTSCGPRERQALSDADIERVMREAAQVQDGTPLVFNLTGGEPFLDFPRLLACVRRGASLGGKVSVVSNAFWARTEEQARARLTELRAAGLTSLAVSVSRFHAPYVPMAQARIALEVADELGLETELKAAVIKEDLLPGGLLEQWQRELDADFINVFPVLPYLRDGAALPEEEYYRLKGLPEQTCPAEVLCVESDGTARSCCGSGVSGSFLALGNVRDSGVAELRQRLESAPRQKILREQGPIAFARAAISAGLAHHLRARYAGPCDLCAHIASHPQLRRIAEEMSAPAR